MNLKVPSLEEKTSKEVRREERAKKKIRKYKGKIDNIVLAYPNLISVMTDSVLAQATIGELSVSDSLRLGINDNLVDSLFIRLVGLKNELDLATRPLIIDGDTIINQVGISPERYMNLVRQFDATKAQLLQGAFIETTVEILDSITVTLEDTTYSIPIEIGAIFRDGQIIAYAKTKAVVLEYVVETNTTNIDARERNKFWKFNGWFFVLLAALIIFYRKEIVNGTGQLITFVVKLIKPI